MIVFAYTSRIWVAISIFRKLVLLAYLFPASNGQQPCIQHADSILLRSTWKIVNYVRSNSLQRRQDTLELINQSSLMCSIFRHRVNNRLRTSCLKTTLFHSHLLEGF